MSNISQASCLYRSLENVVIRMPTNYKVQTYDEIDESLKTLIDQVKNNEDFNAEPKHLDQIDQDTNATIFLSACNDSHGYESVQGATLSKLIEQGAKIDEFNPNWYRWEPIHYAARSTNPDKLRALVRALGKDQINALTSLSENALHIMLQHGKYAKSFNLSCQNGAELSMAKIVASEKDQLVECVKILLRGGIDVNHTNFWGETVILMAIRRKYLKVIKILLQSFSVDLDNSKDVFSGETARQLLKTLNWGIKLMPVRDLNIDHFKILFQFLKTGNEQAFLKFNGGDIREYVNGFDGDGVKNASCTLLQYCFRRGLIMCNEQMKKYSDELQLDNKIITNHLVPIFCQNGMVKCVEHLLDNDVDINFTLRKFHEHLLEVAALEGYYPFVCLLLAHKSKSILSSEICKVVLKVMESKLSKSKNNNLIKTKVNKENAITILLNRMLEEDVDLSDDDQRNLMDAFRLGAKHIKKKNVCLFFKLVGPLFWEEENSSVLEEVKQDAIESHLDDCIYQEEGHQVCINYESLTKSKDDELSAMKVFLERAALNKCLNHPVFRIMIHRKWHNLCVFHNIKYFYLNLSFYVMFYILLNVFILMKFCMHSGWLFDVVFYLGLICLSLFVMKELVQYVTNNSNYFSQVSNYVEITFIGSTALTYLCYGDFVKLTMVLSILLSNLVLLLLMEQVPKLAKYIIILRSVAFYLKYIMFYFIQFVAFAICFFILFFKEGQTVWIDLPNKVFETLILFTGNLDSMDTNNFGEYPVFSKIIFILFVLCIAIILQNLLLGLLVTDMNDIRNDAKLFEQLQRARFILRLEKFLSNKWVNKLLFVNSRKTIFDNQGDEDNYIILNKYDQKILDNVEKQRIQNIVDKRTKNSSLMKLYNYIKLNCHMERTLAEGAHETNKALLERLKVIEERIKELSDIKQIIKSEFVRNKSN